MVLALQCQIYEFSIYTDKDDPGVVRGNLLLFNYFQDLL